jgi:hypothetical protein
MENTFEIFKIFHTASCMAQLSTLGYMCKRNENLFPCGTSTQMFTAVLLIITKNEDNPNKRQ